MSTTLYALSAELAAILHNHDDEIPDDIAAQLESLGILFDAKIEGVLKHRQGLLADAVALKVEIERLKARADAATRRAEWLKQYVYNAMQQVGVTKLKTLTFSATITKSPLRVELAEGAEIPTAYRREKITVELDRAAALDDFKHGQTLPAGLSVVSATHLRIL
jgi:hypothetical protein